MSANTETTGGPPKGYFLCPDCKTTWAGVGLSCWSCRLKLNPRRQFSEADTFKAYPDWTPPIAVPAAHVERRKGQRWKWERNGIAWVCELISGSGYAWNARGCGGYTGEGFLVEADWTGSAGATMTLLADAPPEPGSPFCCDLTAFGPGGCNCKSPPVQEAPKAAPVNPCAPVCNNRGCRLPPLARVIAGHSPGDTELVFLCDADYLAHERGIPAESTGTSYAGPERLPKPQLAADWVEDCLPESGR